MRVFQIIIGIICIAEIFSETSLESESVESKISKTESVESIISKTESVESKIFKTESVESSESEESEESEAKTDSPIMKSCRGPDLNEGVCSHLEDCYEMLNSLVIPLTEFSKNFINASKNVCQAQNATGICCPLSSSYKITTDNQPLLPSDSCGLVHIKRSFPKVVGGRNSEIGAWPWLAQIHYKILNITFLGCTGSIITAQHVLTAAHCVRKALSFVRLGDYDRSNETETKHVDIKITKWLSHENFKRELGLNDLAILFLEKEVQFTDLIAPICLPVSPTLRAKSYVGSKPFVAGWGYTKEGGKASDVLQELQTTVLDTDVCYQAYKLLNLTVLFDSSVLCAGDTHGGKDTCEGDSGGPLMMPELIEGKMRFFVIGVVSYGYGCARKDLAGVYTSIPYHLDWILKHLN